MHYAKSQHTITQLIRYFCFCMAEDEVDRPDRCHGDGGRWRRAPHLDGRSGAAIGAEAVSCPPESSFDVTTTF